MSGVIGRRAFLGGLLLALAPGVACAVPRARAWPHWAASDESSVAAIDHSAWDAFLARYLTRGGDGIMRVEYDRVLPDDHESLSVYIASLSGLPITAYRRAEQLAYWTNLYNALTLRVVLDHYPVRSIRDIRLTPSGPWAKKLVHVEGEGVSLDDIEHRILRPLWHDALILYGLCGATLGGPDLQPRAFTAAATPAMLEAAASAYVNQPRGVRLERGRLVVSSLYLWYRSDFGGTDAAVLAHLRRFAAPPLARILDRQTRIAGHDFDWSLNAATML